MAKHISIVKRLSIIFILAGLIYSLALMVSYENAKASAIKYLQIVNINKESYLELKAQLNDIVTPEVQKLLFSSEVYKGANYPPIHYTVNSIRGNIKGFNHFVFKVNWTINHAKTIDSFICIKAGVVYDAYRAE